MPHTPIADERVHRVIHYDPQTKAVLVDAVGDLCNTSHGPAERVIVDTWDNHVAIVSEDLQYLAALDSSKLPSRAYIRTLAAVLRRLLVDNKLSQAARWLDGMSRFEIEIFEIDHILDLGSVEYMFYGWSPPYGQGQDASAARGFVLHSIPESVHQHYGSPEAAIAAIFPAGQPAPRRATVGLGQLKSSLSMVCRVGPDRSIVRISREDEIKFVANDLGGVHIGSFGAPPSTDQISAKGATWPIKKRLMREPLVEIAGIHWPLFDVWSTALALGKSRQAAEFTQRFHALPEVQTITADAQVLRFWKPDRTTAEVRFGPRTDEASETPAAPGEDG